MDEIYKYSGKTIAKKGEERKENDIVIYLIGNKIDLIYSEKGGVTKEKIEGLANFLKFKHCLISCKWNLNIEEVMSRIISDCLKRRFNESKSYQKLNKFYDF